MEKQSGNFRPGTPACGLIYGIIGLCVALGLLFIGFWRTLFVAAMFALGYLFGARDNKLNTCKAFINKLFPPKGEKL